MKLLAFAAIFAANFVLTACQEERVASQPAPYSLTADAMGRYCGMNILEHPGPKGQIILKQIAEPIWFSSARDTIAFTLLPEEPKDIAAIYVSDMGKAASWDQPGAENWIDARKAVYVIDSAMRGGMGTSEAVPFSDDNAARIFAEQNGGRVVPFSGIPKDYVLGSGSEAGTREHPEIKPMKGSEHG